MFGKYPPTEQSTYFNQYEDDGGYDDDDMDEEGTIPLEEDIDSNYDPSEEEIIEYAEYLGMDPRVDRDLFYIAREGLKAPLPKPWRAMRNSKREIFYVNQATNEMTFVHPCDEFYKNEFAKAKNKNIQKKQNQMNNSNSQSRNKSADIFGNNNLNIAPKKLNPPTQLGQLKPKGILSNSNNNSLLLDKKSMQTSQNNMMNSNIFGGGSASKNNSMLMQQGLYQNSNKQSGMKNDSLNQSKIQNNDSLLMHKMQFNNGQTSANQSNNQQISNEVFIFDESNGNRLSSNGNIPNRANSTHKNEDLNNQSFEENLYDQNQMKSSMNQSKVEFNNSEIGEGRLKIHQPIYTEQSDVMNDDQIDEEIHFFENYLKKQYQNQAEDYERSTGQLEKEFQQKKELDQLRLKNKRDEFQDEKNKHLSNNQKKLSQMKETLKKEKYNELISEMEKQIKQIKQQHEDNVEALNKRAKEDYQYELQQYQTDKGNQLIFKIEEQKRKQIEREQLIQKNRDKIDDTKKKLNLKFQEIEIDLQIQEVQKFEIAEREIKEEYDNLQQEYLKELQQEENRIFKLINRDEKDMQKEIFQKQIQIKDLYQRRYDVKKSEEMNKINDQLRQFNQEERIKLEKRIKKEEQEFINSLIAQKLKDPETKHLKELDDLKEKYMLSSDDIKHQYQSKIKNNEIQGLKRINEIRRQLQEENQKVLDTTFNSYTQGMKFNDSKIDLQQQKLLEELQKNINLKKQDLKHEKQQSKQIQQEIHNGLMMKDFFQSETKVDYLIQKSAQKQDIMDSYAKMLSYTTTKGFQLSSNFLNSYNQNISSYKKYDLPLQINHISNTQQQPLLQPQSTTHDQQNYNSQSNYHNNSHNFNSQHNYNSQNSQNNQTHQNNQQNQNNQSNLNNQHNKNNQQNMNSFIDQKSYHKYEDRQRKGQDDEDDEEEQPITTFLHQNLQQIANMKKGEQNKGQLEQHQDNNNDQINPLQSNRVIFDDDSDDDDFHDSFTQEQQRQKYANNSDNIRNQHNKIPREREDQGEEDDEDEELGDKIEEGSYQNNLPLQRQDLSYRRSINGIKNNQQILVDNQQEHDFENHDKSNYNEASQQKENEMDDDNQNDDPLIQFLDEEWNLIDQMKEELRFDKMLIKKSYEYLQYEKNKMKSQIQQIECSFDNEQKESQQQKIKPMKNKLQQLADAFNEDVKTTRGNQRNLQIREEALCQIEDLLQSGNFSQEQLSCQIDYYQKSVTSYIYPKLNQKIKLNKEGDQSKGNMSLEELLQRTFDVTQQYGDFTSNFQLSNYQTQIKIQQDKQKQLYQLEKQFIQEDQSNNHNIQARLPNKYQNFLYTDAEQLDQIFSEQTSWLKNMKNQLNQDLLSNRFSKISTRRHFLSPQNDNLNQKMQAANLLTKRIGNMTVLNL